MEQTLQQRRRRRAFTDSFKAEVVELCRKGDDQVGASQCQESIDVPIQHEAPGFD